MHRKQTYYTTFISLLLIFLTATSFGQEKKMRFKSVSKRKIELSQDVPTLLNKAELEQKENPTKALDLIEEALAISITENDHYNQAKCYKLIGEINEDISEWDLAILNYDLAKNLLSENFKTPNSIEEYAPIIKGLGRSHFELKQYQEALSYFTELLKLSSSNRNQIDACLLLSQTYYEIGDAVNAEDQALEAERLSGLAKNYEMSAIIAQKEVLNLNFTNGLGQQVDDSTTTFTWGATSDFDSLTIGYSSATSQNKVSNSAYFNTISKESQEKIVLSNILFDNNDYDEAFKELDKAEELVKEEGETEDRILVYKTQAELYDKVGDKDRALDAYQKLDSERVKSKKKFDVITSRNSTILKKQNSISSLSRDIALDQKDYELEYKDETIRFITMRNQRLVIYSLLVIVLLLLIGSFFIYKNARTSKVANQLLALKSLRSQMNPHFIFNSLNSVNHFISQNDERAANKFLSEFSKLMRLVLENSQEDFISLQTEKEIISLYLKLEHYRFRDKFEYELNIDENINLDTLEIPPMLLQPYIENAVWHGLRYKKEMGHLSVDLIDQDTFIQVLIKDNGIGRKKSLELKTEHQKEKKSIGLKNIDQRLNIINKVYKINCTVAITDIDEDGVTGTEIEIKLFKK